MPHLNLMKVKTKTIFDILNDLTFNKVPWSEQDQKQVQSYMLNRLLSMNPDYLPIVAEVQAITDLLSPEQYYNFYLDLLPKKKTFNKYISSKSEKNVKLLSFLAKQLQCSTREIEMYLEVDSSGILEYLTKFGLTEKEVKKEYGI